MKYMYTLDHRTAFHKPQKFVCPQCQHRTFVRYICEATGEYLAEDVGRCDRENHCCYHKRPSEFFKDNPLMIEKRRSFTPLIPEPMVKEEIVFIDPKYIEFKESRIGLDNLYRYLEPIFGTEPLRNIWRKYNVLPSRHWRLKNGYSTAFVQLDEKKRCRQIKVICYNPDTGKRLHEENPATYTTLKGNTFIDTNFPKVWFAGQSLNKGYHQQVLFGTHLISNKEAVHIVEAEKTALICALHYSDSIPGVWVATGGKYGAKWTSLEVAEVLSGHHVILYPDADCFEDWSEKAKILLGYGLSVEVSRAVEDYCSEIERFAGYDLADYICNGTEILLEGKRSNL